MPAIARKAKAPTRLELCRELLEIERDNAATFTRMDEIKTLLKLDAAGNGKFRETFANLGYVSVSPARPEEVTGSAPVLQVAAWNALKEARRDKLIDDGVVRIMDVVKGAYHGRVDVKLHAQGAPS
jgi:hypothetical protein